jgi:MSHA biogenesis protein MshP
MKQLRGKQQAGMALVAALFLIVVLATLGIMALRINTSQQQIANVSLAGLSAQAAAQAGIEYGSNRALRANVCNATITLSLTEAALNGFSVRVTCSRSANHVVNGVNYAIYDLDALAWRGTYGTSDYVSRSAKRTISGIP